MGVVERELRDRAADTLAEVGHLDIRPMFSGFGFYVDGVLVAAAWHGAFQLRFHEGRRWVYRAVDEVALDDPDVLVPMVRKRARALAADPAARRRGAQRSTFDR